jgi:hypothetical protein
MLTDFGLFGVAGVAVLLSQFAAYKKSKKVEPWICAKPDRRNGTDRRNRLAVS